MTVWPSPLFLQWPNVSRLFNAKRCSLQIIYMVFFFFNFSRLNLFDGRLYNFTELAPRIISDKYPCIFIFFYFSPFIGLVFVKHFWKSLQCEWLFMHELNEWTTWTNVCVCVVYVLLYESIDVWWINSFVSILLNFQQQFGLFTVWDAHS